jgi:hypothetical protein
MRKAKALRLVVVFLWIFAVLGAATCLADDPATVPGDPTQYPPGCRTLGPTPVILIEVLSLAAVVSLSLL